jgi:hypothetical protein
VARGTVEIAPIREALRREGITPGELARRMNWVRPDVQRARVQLGMKGDAGRRKTRRQKMDYATAYSIAMVAGLDPHEVGL